MEKIWTTDWLRSERLTHCSPIPIGQGDDRTFSDRFQQQSKLLEIFSFYSTAKDVPRGFIHPSVRWENQRNLSCIHSRAISHWSLSCRSPTTMSFPHWYRLRNNRISRYARTATIASVWLRDLFGRISKAKSIFTIERVLSSMSPMGTQSTVGQRNGKALRGS